MVDFHNRNMSPPVLAAASAHQAYSLDILAPVADDIDPAAAFHHSHLEADDSRGSRRQVVAARNMAVSLVAAVVVDTGWAWAGRRWAVLQLLYLLEAAAVVAPIRHSLLD